MFAEPIVHAPIVGFEFLTRIALCTRINRGFTHQHFPADLLLSVLGHGVAGAEVAAFTEVFTAISGIFCCKAGVYDIFTKTTISIAFAGLADIRAAHYCAVWRDHHVIPIVTSTHAPMLTPLPAAQICTYVRGLFMCVTRI